MARKTWSAKTEITPELIKSREKRKWQISLRRYVLDKNPCVFYAPYFGLDIEKMRGWFESQFKNGLKWEDFGKKWQFDHIVPVTYFNFSSEEELKMCWSFINLKVETVSDSKEGSKRLDVIAAKAYFRELHEKTGFAKCLSLLEKIRSLEQMDLISTDAQTAFIKGHQDYLTLTQDYSTFEFELLNRGRSIDEVNKEMQLFKKNTP